MDWQRLQGLDEGNFITLLFHVMLAYMWDLNRSIYLPFKGMCLTKWSRLYKPFLTFVTLFSVMYMARRVSTHWKMPSIISIIIMRYSGQVAFVSMALIYLSLMLQSTTYISFEHLVLLTAFAHQSQNLSTSRWWKSLGADQVIGMHWSKCLQPTHILINWRLHEPTLLVVACLKEQF